MEGGNKDQSLLYCVSSKESLGDSVIVVKGAACRLPSAVGQGEVCPSPVAACIGPMA
jgi:hypothetical protein